MATKIISTVTTSGFEFGTTYTGLTVTSTGYIDTSPSSVAVDGGTGTQADTVVNDGRILGDVYLGSGGIVTNGALSDTTALITSGGLAVFIRNAIGTAINYGTIVSLNGGTSTGVYLADGGRITNGSDADTVATIEGSYGAHIRNAVGTVSNFGSIISTGSGRSPGVYLSGGLVTNGSGVDTRALILGGSGVFINSTAGIVNNFGTIESASVYGVNLSYGGALTNGSATDRTALIEGATQGLEIRRSAGTVVNFGTILGRGAQGGDDALYASGGSLTNGSGSDHGALIQGYSGAYFGAAATISNFATIQALGVDQFGLEATGGGALTNGGVNDRDALIEGYGGVDLAGTIVAVNFATIAATGVSSGSGAYLGSSGASLTNAAGAVVEGYIGATLYGASTLTNYGTISGASGQAVASKSASATLVVEAGSVFAGQVSGDGGTLELGAGTGVLTGLLAGNDVTVSGFLATTTFDDFATVEIGGGGSFALAGAGGTIGVGQALDLFGALSGTGTLSLTGGTTDIGTGASLSVANVRQTGGTASITASTLTIADLWTQTAGTVTVTTGDRVNFTDAGNTFSGTLAGAGTVGFTGGSDALTGTTLSAALLVVDGAAVTASGAITLSGTLDATSTLTVATAGATLSGKGILNLNNAVSSIVKGASASATLTNTDDRIIGEGQLGDGVMKLVNGGTIDGSLTGLLTINTGANAVTNTGVIENTNTGGTTITGALSNTGVLTVTKGVLEVNGAVSGAGQVKIGGGTADFGSTFTESVDFYSTTGVLELAKSTTYTGKVTGLSTTGKSSLDLLDISFTSGTTKATYSGTATSGTLTVTDGTHTAHITLEGNYVGHTFTTSSDGHGGTTVVDPTTPRSGGHIAPLVGAIAGFGVPSSATAMGSDPLWRFGSLALAMPRTDRV